jgi:hypothetical protein
MGRNDLPTWLLALMGSTGLFHRRAVAVAAALIWVYDQPDDGAYEWWPQGPAEHRESVAGPFGNRALVGDNDYMFHRVGSIGDPAKWDLARKFSVRHDHGAVQGPPCSSIGTLPIATCRTSSGPSPSTWNATCTAPRRAYRVSGTEAINQQPASPRINRARADTALFAARLLCSVAEPAAL